MGSLLKNPWPAPNRHRGSLKAYIKITHVFKFLAARFCETIYFFFLAPLWEMSNAFFSWVIDTVLLSAIGLCMDMFIFELPRLGNLNFCVFHLGTSSAYSATQRYRFVHGHVHILTPKAWEPQFLYCSPGNF